MLMGLIYFQITVQLIFRTSQQDSNIADRQIKAGGNINKKYVWDFERSEEYTFNIESNVAAFVDLQHQVNEAISGEDKDRNLTGFVNLMGTVCDPRFAKTLNANKTNIDANSGNSKKQPWFDQDCDDLRKQFYTELNKFRLD